MGAKRALIVDDSRSARAFLSRILEKYEIDVETAESAEQAIEYLGHHRPDVIFMDHQMPGMDGFQAVQVIKNNPRTAMIPIMMYTSQEGELFLGQARALGAVGVLPKQIKPADVSKVLYQLHLVPERRTDEQTTFRPILVGNVGQNVGVSSNTGNFSTVEIISAHTESAPPPPPAPPPTAGKPLTEGAMREMFADLRGRAAGDAGNAIALRSHRRHLRASARSAAQSVELADCSRLRHSRGRDGRFAVASLRSAARAEIGVAELARGLAGEWRTDGVRADCIGACTDRSRQSSLGHTDRKAHRRDHSVRR
jgi:CheY-like chemotaxis protein